MQLTTRKALWVATAAALPITWLAARKTIARALRGKSSPRPALWVARCGERNAQ
ncbi:MAG: hypothetical protein N2109_02995 [Fimbriimonadales bacterium]|nr:hypothetical protein [Fimbriimonadales bacterium]